MRFYSLITAYWRGLLSKTLGNTLRSTLGNTLERLSIVFNLILMIFDVGIEGRLVFVDGKFVLPFYQSLKC